MEIGEIKTIENKGLKFDIKALDDYALIYDDNTKQHIKRQLGEVITDVPDNEFGVKKGLQMLIS